MLGWAGLERGDARRVLPLAAAHGFVMAAVFVLKPVRNALFLDSLGIGQLPYVLIMVAVVGGASVGLFSRLTRNVPIRTLVHGTYLFLALNLLAFRAAIPAGGAWLQYVFYIWVTIFSLMSVSLLLLLANAAFNPREARRLFGTIVTGGNAGAIAGGTFTGAAVQALGTENLLLVCAGFLLLCMILVRRVVVETPVKEPSTRQARGILGTMAAYPLLRYTALTAGLAAVVAAVVDIQFNEIADSAFPTKDAKTAFFGSFFAILNAFVLVFQLLATNRVLRGLGVGPALLFLPLSLAGGSLAVLLIPGLLGGILVKVGDMAFRHSVHKSAAEILFLPVPSSVKQESKVFLDTTVDNLAKGLGALLVIGLTASLGFSYRDLSFVSLGLVAVWLALMLPLRRAYVDAFRSALERRELDPDEMRTEIKEAGSLRAIRRALDSTHERQLVYALGMLQMAPVPGTDERVQQLLSHRSAEVRREALKALSADTTPALTETVERLLGDPVAEVRVEAVRWLCRSEGGDHTMEEFLGHSDFLLRSAALGCISEYGSEREKALVTPALLRELVESGTDSERARHARTQAARVLGVVDGADLRDALDGLMDDPDPEVALEAVRSAGRTGDVRYLSRLIPLLGDRGSRLAAREALAAIGPRAIPPLLEAFGQAPARVRSQIPAVFAGIRDQASVDALLALAATTVAPYHLPVVKSLSKLRARASGLRFDPDDVDRLLDSAIRQAHQLAGAVAVLADGNGPEHSLLARASSERLAQKVDEIFRLLALCHPHRDMYHAYLGVVSGRRAVRASALEFLENVLERERMAELLPLLEPTGERPSSEPEVERLGIRIRSVEDALDGLLRGSDPWLKACAVHYLTAHPNRELVGLALEAAADPDPIVSETAARLRRAG